MSTETEAIWIRLRDLALEQRAAVEAGNLDKVEAIAEMRQQIFFDIQESGALSGEGNSAAPELVIREILAIDEEAMKVLKAGMQEISHELENINTFKVLFQGAIDGVRSSGDAPGF